MLRKLSKSICLEGNCDLDTKEKLEGNWFFYLFV